MAFTLTRLDTVPAGLLQVDARRLYELLPGPTLLTLDGKREPPLFVSVLLHGNETTGFQAVQRLLGKYRKSTLPRSLMLFIGNVVAARYGLRRLDEQPDYNRIWPGGEGPETRETELAQQIMAEMAVRGLFANVDVHNNTGRNPQYSCVSRLDADTLHLAAMFGRLVIHSRRPRGTQAAAFGSLCPSVTLECGKPGQAYGVDHAYDFLDACLNWSRFPSHPLAPHDLDLYHAVAQVKIAPGVSFCFGGEEAELLFEEEMDRLNFTQLSSGHVFARLGCCGGGRQPLLAYGEDGGECTDEYFATEEEMLVLRKPVVPSMLSLDQRIVRQDCLCYFLQRVSPPEGVCGP